MQQYGGVHEHTGGWSRWRGLMSAQAVWGCTQRSAFVGAESAEESIVVINVGYAGRRALSRQTLPPGTA